MIQLGTHLHPGCAPHHVRNGGRAERAIDLHPPRVILIVVIKNWTMEAANRAWWFLLGSKTHKQAIIYESEQANLKSDIQVVLMCTYLVVTGKRQTFWRIQLSKNKQKQWTFVIPDLCYVLRYFSQTNYCNFSHRYFCNFNKYTTQKKK